MARRRITPSPTARNAGHREDHRREPWNSPASSAERRPPAPRLRDRVGGADQGVRPYGTVDESGPHVERHAIDRRPAASREWSADRHRTRIAHATPACGADQEIRPYRGIRLADGVVGVGLLTHPRRPRIAGDVGRWRARAMTVMRTKHGGAGRRGETPPTDGRPYDASGPRSANGPGPRERPQRARGGPGAPPHGALLETGPVVRRRRDPAGASPGAGRLRVSARSVTRGMRPRKGAADDVALE